jgi:hypothetical protein
VVAPGPRGQWLGIAATLVSTPTLYNVANIAAFDVCVMMHGF